MKKAQKMIPRIGMFRSTRMSINHMVLVDGDEMRPLCIRTPLKHGIVLPADARLTCQNCKNKGWTKTLGAFGQPLEKDSNGRFIARQI